MNFGLGNPRPFGDSKNSLYVGRSVRSIASFVNEVVDFSLAVDTRRPLAENVLMKRNVLGKHGKDHGAYLL